MLDVLAEKDGRLAGPPKDAPDCLLNVNHVVGHMNCLLKEASFVTLPV